MPVLSLPSTSLGSPARQEKNDGFFHWPAALRQRFPVIVFDWDGTAVAARGVAVPELVRALDSLLRKGTTCVAITGTGFGHIDEQCAKYLNPEAKRNLFACTNRGSEVFSFCERGSPVLAYSRYASPEEERALDGAAIGLKQYLSTLGLSVEVIFNRLNRRKIDLIPLACWQEPKKSEFRELLTAVTERLERAAKPTTLSAVMQAAHRMAIESGLANPKITSDIKHVEIGLTDKSDSLRWVEGHLVRGRSRSPSDVAVFGDEFGPVGGVPGSDSLMRVPGLETARYVSVGVEPEGCPDWVILLKGGPERFHAFLRGQAELANRHEGPPVMNLAAPARTWLIEQQGLDPARERSMETLFTVGNGYLCVRGATEIPMPSSEADLFLAGHFAGCRSPGPISPAPTAVSPAGLVELAAFPTPFSLCLRVAGQELFPERSWMKEHTRTLDLRKGTFIETFTFVDDNGRKVSLRVCRLAGFSDPHLLLEDIEVFCQNHAGRIELDTEVASSGAMPKYPLVRLVSRSAPAPAAESILLEVIGSPFRLAIASRVRCGSQESGTPKIEVEAEEGRPVRLRRFVSVFSSRDTEAPQTRSCQHLAELRWDQFDDHFARHEEAWRRFWDVADIDIKARPDLAEALRFNLYHLRIAANQDPRVSVGARALSGRAYLGHVFWDTEIYMLPFYTHVAPEIARSLLRYRYRSLEEARKRAARAGLRGAWFAWESAATGADVTPAIIHIEGTGKDIPIFTAPQSIHINADIAYSVWRYWLATGDAEFLKREGAEILIETARFWQSRTKREGGCFHLFGVVGPDEYHYGVDDNAYTNWMARCNLDIAAKAVEWIRTEAPQNWEWLKETLEIDSGEIEEWRRVASLLFVPEPNADGVIEQFRGFFDLREPDTGKQRAPRAPIESFFSWEEVNKLRLIKQPDVLMIPFLFPDALSSEVIRANFRFYDPITDHVSSLSPSVQAAVAARAGHWEEAERYWTLALNLDLLDKMGNTALGLHAANMGGAWQALVFHFLGAQLEGESPVLGTLPWPSTLTWLDGVRLKLWYRGKIHELSCHQGKGGGCHEAG